MAVLNATVWQNDPGESTLNDFVMPNEKVHTVQDQWDKFIPVLSCFWYLRVHIYDDGHKWYTTAAILVGLHTSFYSSSGNKFERECGCTLVKWIQGYPDLYQDILKYGISTTIDDDQAKKFIDIWDKQITRTDLYPLPTKQDRINTLYKLVRDLAPAFDIGYTSA